MPASSDYSCASVYSYHHDHSPAAISPRSARRRLLAETDSPVASPPPMNNRMSVASGPKVRRYEDVSWDDETWSRTSTMTGLSLKVKDAVKTKCGIKDNKEAHHADALHRQLSVLSTSATETSSFTSDASSAQLQTVTSRHCFDSASAVSIALSSTSNSSSGSSSNIATPRKSPTLLEAFDASHAIADRQYGGQQWPQYVSGQGQTHDQGYGQGTDTKTTPRASGRTYRPTISQPFSLAVLSTPMSMDGQPNSAMPMSGRPMIASASPNFSLISLADAQQRERDRSKGTPYEHKPQNDPAQRTITRPVEPVPIPASPQSHRLKNKKSFMKFLNKTPKSKRQDRPNLPQSPDAGHRRETEQYQAHQGPEYHKQDHSANQIASYPGPTDFSQAESSSALQPLLQLRPVSMNISRHIPDQYFAIASPRDSPSTATLADQSHIEDSERLRLITAEVEHRVANLKKAHQLQVYELEAQVRELRLSLESALSGSTSRAACDNCGHERGSKPASGIMNRARVKTAGPRGVFGSGSLYEAK